MNDVPAQRQRQSVILLFPPDPQVLANEKPFVFPGQLPFMNNQSRFRLA